MIAIIKDRTCPVCGEEEYIHFADENLSQEKIGAFTYSSRKLPEFMCFRLVRCTHCDLVYAPNPPDYSFLACAYSESGYDSGYESICAAKSYAKALCPYLTRIAHRNAAVDVGAGNGSLLPWLMKAGFNPAVGIEPSCAAIGAAPESIRHLLREGMFSPEMLRDVKLSLICSFMTLEHMIDPRSFVKVAYELLEPGGMIAVVVHNWQGLLNRMMGRYSPIIDVEHLQLFSPKTIRLLLSNFGFTSIKIKAITNSYPMRYWLRLMPFPAELKIKIDSIFLRYYLANLKISLPVGNILAIGTK